MSTTASALHTELTRLLYIYSAVEIAVRTMTPSLGERDAILPAARKNLVAFRAEPLLHYDCGVRHLRMHVNHDPWLSSNADLIKQFGPDGTPGPAIGIQVGSKFRHIMAHGLIATPQPIRRGESWEAGAQPELCAIRHASAALLHSLQMMFRCALDSGSLSYSDDCEVDEELWTVSASGSGAWKHVFSPAERVLTLHLRTDDGPKD